MYYLVIVHFVFNLFIPFCVKYTTHCYVKYLSLIKEFITTNAR